MVAIKDMEIPKSCSECMVRHECKVADEWDEFDWNYYERCEGCPLIEIEEPKVGKWITKDGREQGYDIAGIKTWYKQIMCNKCGFIKTALEGYAGQRNYCPNCGAKMVGAENG